MLCIKTGFLHQSLKSDFVSNHLENWTPRQRILPNVIPWNKVGIPCLICSFLFGFSFNSFAQPARNQQLPAPAPEAQLATTQVVWPFESADVYVNGAAYQLLRSSKIISGRTMLPLRETARIFDIPILTISNVNGIRFGKLDIYPNLQLARLNGIQLPLENIGVIIDGESYITLKALEAAIGAVISVNFPQKLITITISRLMDDIEDRPIARFATDKQTYRIGELVKIVEYSYDPNGLPIVGKNFSGREEAFFESGEKTIILTVTNSAGRISLPYSVNITISNEIMASEKQFSLLNSMIGRTFSDPMTLSYPQIKTAQQDQSIPLLVSDSPEVPDRSGLVYEDVINGAARLLAYHVNSLPERARIVVLAFNLNKTDTKIRITRLGKTASTRIVSTLGQSSLFDFLTSNQQAEFTLGPSMSAPLFISSELSTKEGLNLMMDLESSNSILLSVFFLESKLFPQNPAERTWLEFLRHLPVLPADGQHPRGTFLGATRELTVDLTEVQQAARLVIGDGIVDPPLVGRDALTGRRTTLSGNYGVTYKIRLINPQGIVGAFIPRGGMYSGAVRVGNVLQALPESGILIRQDTPMLIFRNLGNATTELEFIPASGSFLPVCFLFYRPEALISILK